MRLTTICKQAIQESARFGRRTRSPRELDAKFTASNLIEFNRLCGQTPRLTEFPTAKSIESRVPIYEAHTLLRGASGSEHRRSQIMDELYRCLLDGPGVYVVQNCFADHQLLDRVDKVFDAIILKERGEVKADHFAPGGKNERIWNSFQKHAFHDPASFVEYYSSETLALVSEAWLGPGFQVTAQVNVVKPGGRAQKPHRDYHLGFQSESVAGQFPIPNQIASQFLTLQGAVAHTDMPLASGPTMLLPYSHHFEYGYMAYRREEFQEVFHEKSVQLELKRGDGLFFNPALFHAAGNNNTHNLQRTANLLQISASYGKAMESVDRSRLLLHTWPDMLRLLEREGGDIVSPRIQAVIKAVADGYSFPTNLDRDPPPTSGNCPQTQQDLALTGLQERWSIARLQDELVAGDTKRRAN